MKRIMILMAFMACNLAAVAQKGMHIDALFEGKVIPMERMVETRVRGRSLSKYGLTYFRSLRFEPSKKEREQVVRLVEQDIEGVPQTDYQRITRKRSDLIFLQLQPVGGNHRMLCYKYMDEILLIIYLEGPKASLETLKNITN